MYLNPTEVNAKHPHPSELSMSSYHGTSVHTRIRRGVGEMDLNNSNIISKTVTVNKNYGDVLMKTL